MIYRLAFLHTKDGYLKITAAAKGTPTLTAIHLNPEVFGASARIANLSAEQIENLRGTAERAWPDDGIDVCCEAIELEADQLKDLGFIEDWRRLA